METALASGEQIKVDVRQVLVPVVVTDREGHHVTGLTQADFKVFEDGVEQKITAFSVENRALPQAGIPAKSEQPPPLPRLRPLRPNPRRARQRAAYLHDLHRHASRLVQ